METLKTPENQESKNEAFTKLFEESVQKHKDFIEYDLPYPKQDFLKYLVENQNVLLHGTNWKGVDELVPMPANCQAKEFGNQNAVFGTKDSILPMFYAIRDKTKYRGSSNAGCSRSQNEETGEMETTYHFGITKQNQEPWSSGVVCILDADNFTQGHDDDGELINEYASLDPVVPLTRLRIEPEEFPYLDQVEYLS